MGRRARITLMAFGAFAALIVGLLAFVYWYDSTGQRPDLTFDTRVADPAYPTEHPVVLFDEAHENFHTTEDRYRPFADLISHDGYQVVPTKQPFGPETLADVKILVIVNALGPDGHATSPAFTDGECAIVDGWVSRGGALLLVADHSPFGAAAQDLAKRLGVEMFLRYARDDVNSDGDNERLVFSRENGLLADHPITNGRNDAERLGRVVSFTGQSLEGPPGSVPFLRLGDDAYDWESRSIRYPARGHAQGVAFERGLGRVVVLGEAGMLTAQVDPLGFRMGMNRPGSDDRQLVLNVMHWLSQLTS